MRHPCRHHRGSSRQRGGRQWKRALKRSAHRAACSRATSRWTRDVQLSGCVERVQTLGCRVLPRREGRSVPWHRRAVLPVGPGGLTVGRRQKMAEVSLSATETALENQKIGALQIRVVVICTLIQMCDGYDINSIGWAVPSLIGAWHLPPPEFSTAFVWSSIGIMVGALSSGPLGDRVGRRPLLLASLMIFGLASLLSAFAGSLGMLSALRFFTGLGIGGAFSGTVALTGDYTPKRRRATMIMVTFTGAPLGGFVGGQLVALLLQQNYGWPMIFVIGGVFPLALALLVALWLPESPRFLLARANLAPRHLALLQRLDIS